MTKITVGRSPDADDAFMYYAMLTGKVKTEDYTIDYVTEDIERLNKRAERAELEVTAVSAHAYATLSDKYYVMNVGSSLGKGYGPIIVANKHVIISELRNMRIGIPGTKTTAYLLLRMAIGSPHTVELEFNKIPQAVLDGKIDAGLLIHEAQLTHTSLGLKKVLDLGEWWNKETNGQPVPLGLDVTRRDLGIEFGRKFSRLLKESINYALSHKDEALDFAMQYAREAPRKLVEKFVMMYVNDLTVSMGNKGLESLRTLYERGAAMGLLKPVNFEVI